MILENTWPLWLLGFIPLLIILYLLKPKGKDHLFSSTLLWKKIVKNQETKTFFEKFTSNILMYLQILILVLLAVSLMSPYFSRSVLGKGKQILVIDTTASMQHLTGNGETRMENGINQVCDYIRSLNAPSISVITCDGVHTTLLAVDVKEKEALYELLHSIQPTDLTGNLSTCVSTVNQLQENLEGSAQVYVLTDVQGCGQLSSFEEGSLSGLFLAGEKADNISNDSLSMREQDNGTYDYMVTTTNHGDKKVTFDVSLFSEKGELLGILPQTLLAGESNITLFTDLPFSGEYCYSTISGFVFEQDSYDSLKKDNSSYVLKNNAKQYHTLLISEGNLFLENACLAVSGKEPDKSSTLVQGDYDLVICDAGCSYTASTSNALKFADTQYKADEVLHCMPEILPTPLTKGLENFPLGINQGIAYSLPSWAAPFLQYEEQVLGYYGEHDGIREVVVGFDLRESDLALHGEFPIFIANIIDYLTNTHLLTQNVYHTGEAPLLNSWVGDFETSLPLYFKEAGLYSVEVAEEKENYVVLFPTYAESDGKGDARTLSFTEKVTTDKIKFSLKTTFLLLAMLLLILEFCIYIYQRKSLSRFHLTLRLILFLLLLAALFDLKIPVKSSNTTTIFMVDLSDSNMEHKAEMEQYLKKTLREMPKGNQCGILCFGNDAMIEQFVCEHPAFSEFMSTPGKDATNFEDAFQKALTMLPGNSTGRIVLLTDGKETRGNLNSVSNYFSQGGIELLSLKFENQPKQDAYIDNCILPAYLHPGDSYSLTVIVESNYETDASLSLYHASVLTGQSNVHLRPGTNRFVLQQEVTQDTLENLNILLDAQGDSCPENNYYTTFCTIQAPPKILLVSYEKTNTDNFTALLSSVGIDYSILSCRNTPDTLEKMLHYEAIVLLDTPVYALPKGFLSNIESYVRDYGRGLVCTGGTNSFAMGGYRDTVLETVLPVSMLPNNVSESPDMCMLFIIDHSGSMVASGASQTYYTKLDLAIQATIAAIDHLRKTDYFGVLTFDDQITWQVNITKNTAPEKNKQKVMGIPEGGGTSILPALEEAYDQIVKNDAAVKHIVLLTDGNDSANSYDTILKQIKEAGITLSTVAIGNDADTVLLEQMADTCNGRFYYSDFAEDLPLIFAKEVYLGGGAYIREGDFVPNKVGSSSLIDQTFVNGWPALHGYIASGTKTAAHTLLSYGPTNDPILSYWHYGLGNTVAWNSDISGEWSSAYSGLDDFAQLWKNLLEFSCGNANLEEDDVSFVRDKDKTLIRYEAKEYSKETRITVAMTDPTEKTADIELPCISPGIYEVQIPTSEKGLYLFHVVRREGDEILHQLTGAVSVQFSDEYKYDISSENYDRFVEKYGTSISQEDLVWNKLSVKQRKWISLYSILLCLGSLLFFIDVACRRLQFQPSLTMLFRKSSRKETSYVAAHSKEALYDTTKSATGSKEAAPPSKESSVGSKKSPRKNKEETTLDTATLLKKKDDRHM